MITGGDSRCDSPGSLAKHGTQLITTRTTASQVSNVRVRFFCLSTGMRHVFIFSTYFSLAAHRAPWPLPTPSQGPMGESAWPSCIRLWHDLILTLIPASGEAGCAARLSWRQSFHLNTWMERSVGTFAQRRAGGTGPRKSRKGGLEAKATGLQKCVCGDKSLRAGAKAGIQIKAGRNHDKARPHLQPSHTVTVLSTRKPCKIRISETFVAHVANLGSTLGSSGRRPTGSEEP